MWAGKSWNNAGVRLDARIRRKSTILCSQVGRAGWLPKTWYSSQRRPALRTGTSAEVQARLHRGQRRGPSDALLDQKVCGLREAQRAQQLVQPHLLSCAERGTATPRVAVAAAAVPAPATAQKATAQSRPRFQSPSTCEHAAESAAYEFCHCPERGHAAESRLSKLTAWTAIDEAVTCRVEHPRAYIMRRPHARGYSPSDTTERALIGMFRGRQLTYI